MQVLVGNANAIEGYRDASSDDPDLVRYRPLEGERVTTIQVPAGTQLSTAFLEVVTALTYHMEADSKPAWIECDNPTLKGLLLDHYGLTAAEAKKPTSWGKGGDDE
jgi:hypothetical protein